MSKHVPCPADLITYVLDNEESDYLDHGRPIGHPYWLARKFGNQMAAAPEMLEQLKLIRSTLVPEDVQRIEIDAVIAKATGGEP